VVKKSEKIGKIKKKINFHIVSIDTVATLEPFICLPGLVIM